MQQYYDYDLDPEVVVKGLTWYYNDEILKITKKLENEENANNIEVYEAKIKDLTDSIKIYNDLLKNIDIIGKIMLMPDQYVMVLRYVASL